MKKVIVGIWLSMLATVAFACTTQTITMPDGRMMVCTTCCFGGNCSTNCF